MSIYRIDREVEAIREVQRYLRAVSYLHETIPHVGIDGIYGEETKAAVRAFQLLFSIRETGVADMETFGRLYEEFILARKEKG